MIGPMPVCMHCVHYDRTRPVTCAAFPERIPDLIWRRGNKHLQPIGGEVNGILYEPAPEQPESISKSIQRRLAEQRPE
jgi:hypothetical protein